MYRAILTFSMVVLVVNGVCAEDWSGKLIMLLHSKVQLGRPTETGLLLDGEKLNIIAAYKVRSETGTYLELAGKQGMIYKQDAVLIDDSAAY